jgi:chromosome segregation ATPase
MIKSNDNFFKKMDYSGMCEETSITQKNNVSSLKQEIDFLLETVAELKMNLRVCKEFSDTLVRERENALQKVQDMEISKINLENLIDELEISLDKTKEELDSVRALKHTLDYENMGLNEKVTSLEKNIAKQNEDLMKRSIESDFLAGEIEAVRKLCLEYLFSLIKK